MSERYADVDLCPVCFDNPCMCTIGRSLPDSHGYTGPAPERQPGARHVHEGERAGRVCVLQRSGAWGIDVDPSLPEQQPKGFCSASHDPLTPREPLRIGGLFEGYGGLTMGIRSVLGGELAWYSEIDEGALKILGHHHPDVPNLGDITAVDWTTVGRVDVLTGGFPCQDVSGAGKQAGLRPGTRSGLWAHFAYAIAELRPGLVVAENVRGLLTARGEPLTEELAAAWAARDLTTHLLHWLNNRRAIALSKGRTDDARLIATRRARVVGLRRRAVDRARRAERLIARAIATVLGSLDDLGYDAVWHGLRAADIGAPHGRFRIFIFAWPRGQAVSPALAAALRRAIADGPARPSDVDVTALLKTPTAQLAVNGGSQHPDQRKAGGHGPTLADEVEHLLPTPSVADSTGGHANRSGSRSGELLLPGIARAVEVPLLPTPAVNDMGEGKTVDAWDDWTDRMRAEHGNGNGHGKSLAIEAQRLLPTPRTGSNRASRGALTGTSPGCVERHAGQWSAPGLEQAVELAAGVLPREYDDWSEVRGASARLLPTPVVTDANGARNKTSGRSSDARPHAVGTTLGDVVYEAAWGDYQPAIDRWATIIGRPAPAPTELAPKGGQRLAAPLPEWMMGLPAGHITAVPGITRNEALKAAGNGVVPHQAAAALREVLTWLPVRHALGLAA